METCRKQADAELRFLEAARLHCPMAKIKMDYGEDYHRMDCGQDRHRMDYIADVLQLGLFQGMK